MEPSSNVMGVGPEGGRKFSAEMLGLRVGAQAVAAAQVVGRADYPARAPGVRV